MTEAPSQNTQRRIFISGFSVIHSKRVPRNRASRILADLANGIDSLRGKLWPFSEKKRHFGLNGSLSWLFVLFQRPRAFGALNHQQVINAGFPDRPRCVLRQKRNHLNDQHKSSEQRQENQPLPV
jgi:hypothetical protein